MRNVVGIGLKREAKGDSDIAVMDQDIGERRRRPENRRTQSIIGVLTQGRNDVGRRPRRAALPGEEHVPDRHGC